MFYTTKTLTSVQENFLEDIQVEASVKDPGIKGAIELVAENEMNYNAIMQAIGVDEINYFSENGTEIVYESSSVKGFFAKLKEFFMKVYEKIKSLFKSFIALLDSWLKNDSDFVKKYRATLLQVDSKGFTFKGYKFTTGNVKVGEAADKMESVLKGTVGLSDSSNIVKTDAKDIEKQTDTVRNWNSNKEDYTELFRGAALGESNKKYDYKDFTETLAKKLRSNEDAPVEITNISVNDYLEIISNFKTAKKEAEDDFKAAEKKINEIIKGLNDKEKEIDKSLSGEKDKAKIDSSTSAIRFASASAAAYKVIVGILQTIQGAKMSALKQNNRQAKAVCVKLLRYKPKNESYSESSLLSAVTLK